MKNILLLLLVALIAACKVDDQESILSIETNAIVYNNNLPVDGCAEHLALTDTKGDEIRILLPTEATMPLFNKLLNAEIAKIPKNEYSGNLNFAVTLRYRETQQKGELICGWGKKSIVERIEIISITKK